MSETLVPFKTKDIPLILEAIENYAGDLSDAATMSGDPVAQMDADKLLDYAEAISKATITTIDEGLDEEVPFKDKIKSLGFSTVPGGYKSSKTDEDGKK